MDSSPTPLVSTSESYCTSVLDAIQPRQYPPHHFDTLCDLDPHLNRLRRDVGGMDVPQRMPAYWKTWEGIERRLDHILSLSSHPDLRSQHAQNVLHDGMRRIYWGRALECASR